MKNVSTSNVRLRGAYRRAPVRMRMQQFAQGAATIQTLNEDGSLAQQMHVRNLILNTGLDMVRTRAWVSNFEYCVLGTASTATSVTPTGTPAASQSGTAVTITNGSFSFTDTLTDAGRTIKWGSGEESRIVTVTDPTHAVVTPSQNVSSGPFVVYFTNQTAATMTEVQRTNNYVTGVANCGTTIVGAALAFKRTFDFPTEVGGVTYREVAYSHSGSAAADIFSRIKLPVDLTLVAGQRVRVIYTLTLTATPSALVSKTANIVGWPVAPSTTTDGTDRIQLLGFAQIDSTGATWNTPAQLSLEPSSVGSECSIFLSTVSTAPADVGSSVDRTGTSPAVKTDTIIDPASVTSGVGYAEKVVTFDIGDGNRSDWRSLGFGKHDGMDSFAYVDTGYVFVFDEAQTKDELHTLEIRFEVSWAGTLA
jgi:hypothetical protein